MKKIVTTLSIIAFSALLFSGCADKVQRIDMNNDTGDQVAGLDYRDFNQAATEATQSMLRSPAITNRVEVDIYLLSQTSKMILCNT